MWTPEVNEMIIRGIGETLYMMVFSTAIGYLFGLPLLSCHYGQRRFNTQ